jgi:uncharacterized protein (TIGR02452 family)
MHRHVGYESPLKAVISGQNYCDDNEVGDVCEWGGRELGNLGKHPTRLPMQYMQVTCKKSTLPQKRKQITMLDLAARRKICEDTIVRSPAIAASTPGGSLDSVFFPSQLPPLSSSSSSPPYPNLTLQTPIEIVDSDAFALARRLRSRLPADQPAASSHKIGVLNLASDERPGGGWRRSLSRTQEEALCYSSTLYPTLRPEWYPWPNTGPGSCAGIMSPGVVVHRGTLDEDLVELPPQERCVVAVMTVAAPRFPKLSEDGNEFADADDLRDLREKILLVLRMAAEYRVTRLVLGAMGCGAYGCPPRAVAREMKQALERDEFAGWFEVVSFAIYAAGPAGQRNLAAFRDVFGVVGVRVLS